MKKLIYIFFMLTCISTQAKNISLADARAIYKTNFSTSAMGSEPIPTPPKDIFIKSSYTSGALQLQMLISVAPKDNVKHPAIIWITGGESNSVGNMWDKPSVDNDQTARQYREQGIILALPSLRGGNDNEGVIEFNYGEVDDIIAAAEQVAKLPCVDPKRIYLGGHSTGGTLALLTSEVVSKRNPNLFKGVFSFGATEATINEQMYNNVELTGDIEISLRAPIAWLEDIGIPTWIIEGEGGNFDSLEKLCKAGKRNTFIHCLAVSDYDHFNVLAPTNTVIAKGILSGEIELTEEMIRAQSKQQHK